MAGNFCRSTLPLVLLAWVLLGITRQVHAACTIPEALRGTWYKVDNGFTITMTEQTTTGQDVQGNGQYTDDFNCVDSSGDTYMFGTSTPVKNVEDDDVHGYFCWKLIRVTDATYFVYPLTETATFGTFREQKVVESISAPAMSAVCSLDASSMVPTLLYKSESGNLEPVTTTEQQCSPDLFATYTYVKDDAGCADSDTKLDFCVDRQTARVNYTACGDPKILFSEGGVLSCVASATVDSTVYQFLVNQDSSPDNVNTFKFVCMAVQKNGDTENATVYAGDCITSDYSHRLALNRIVSCPLTDTESEEDPIWPIIVGVIAALVVIVVIIIVVVVCVKLHLKRKQRLVTPSKPVQNGSSLHTNPDDAPPSPPADDMNGTVDNIDRENVNIASPAN